MFAPPLNIIRSGLLISALATWPRGAALKEGLAIGYSVHYSAISKQDNFATNLSLFSEIDMSEIPVLKEESKKYVVSRDATFTRLRTI